MTPSHSIILDKAKPFVKWAGGKRQLVQTLSKNVPKKYSTYYEPFLGGGAFLFHILGQNPSRRCIVSDTNADLIKTYITIRDDPDRIISMLNKHAREYDNDHPGYYARIRSSTPRSDAAKASRLIFLNRTCFNGLYRVNKQGKFNVPIGSCAHPVANIKNIRAVSSILRSSKIKIRCTDFETAVSGAKKGDFIYFDPPYKPVSQTASFTSYSSDNFGDDELKRLATLCKNLTKKGCYVMTTNSNLPGIRKLFGRGWRASRVSVNRPINSDASKRTGHKELLLKNYVVVGKA